jgi:SAM-dependent methyltransferase
VERVNRQGRHRGGEGLPHDWDASYAGTPPWDIGRPQRPFVELADAGALHGAVLDLGCGTGEHTLMAAERGLPATGVDVAPTAIAKARAKASQRGLDARFLLQDALTVDILGESFDVVLDCGFFHVLPDDARGPLADVLRRVMAPGASYYLLCFSDRVPGDAGPRRIGKDEIRTVFAAGFSVDWITESSIEATFIDIPVPAWLARITRQ